MALWSVAGCSQVHCVETLAPYEKILHGLPGMLVAYAVAWAGLDAARYVLRAPETGAGRVAGVCALGIGTAGLAALVPGYALLLLGVGIAALLPMAWVARMVRAGEVRNPWRMVGALACTAAAGVVLLVLGAANTILVEGAGRVCAPEGVRIAPVEPKAP